MQADFSMPQNRLRCFSAPVATLSELAQIYSPTLTEVWLRIQIRDLAEFSGVKDKPSVEQLSDVAKVIIAEFYYLKITELMVFFQMFKSGKFGRFYGAVDGLVITEAIWEFLDYRTEQLRIIDHRRQEALKSEKILEMQRRASSGETLSYEEYLKTKIE